MIYDIRERKNAILGYEKKSSKTQKIAFFPKGLTHVFGLKTIIFATSFFRQNRPGKGLFRYSRTKKIPFEAIKTRRSKSGKIDIFQQGLTHGFGPKTAIFFKLFLERQNRPGKCALRFFRTKKRLSRL